MKYCLSLLKSTPSNTSLAVPSLPILWSWTLIMYTCTFAPSRVTSLAASSSSNVQFSMAPGRFQLLYNVVAVMRKLHRFRAAIPTGSLCFALVRTSSNPPTLYRSQPAASPPPKLGACLTVSPPQLPLFFLEGGLPLLQHFLHVRCFRVKWRVEVWDDLYFKGLKAHG